MSAPASSGQRTHADVHPGTAPHHAPCPTTAGSWDSVHSRIDVDRTRCTSAA